MPSVGDTMINFELPNQDGDLVSLSDFRGKKVVLFAFPTADKPTCTKHACAYRDTYEQFTEHNTVILGITSSPTIALKKWRAHHNFPYDLLSDSRGTVLDSLGIWANYVVNGVDLNYAKRSYWVIDEEGIIREAQIDVDEVNSVHESLQFIQAVG
ncbi:MAG: peroxiredoxin [Chloroflexota bacterium]